MRLTVVHTADWQLGKPFAQFPVDVAARLSAARLDGIDRVAEIGLAAGAGHVLVAGDVFDGERVADAIVRAALGRMAAYPALVWHLLPGNHDPARPGGIWGRIARLGVSANVQLCLEAAPVRLGEAAVLLPAPLAAREMRTDPTAWMDAAGVPPGLVRIGLAHGSVQGFGSLGEAAVPIDAGRRRSAGLDYLALGDWHGTREIAEGVWYSGTHEPDGFVDNDPGNVLVVHVAGRGAPPVVEKHGSGHYRWLERRVLASRLADLEPLADEVSRLGPRASRHLLRLRLEGALPAGERLDLEDRLAGLAAQLAAMQTDARALATSVSAEDLSRLGDAGEGLAAIAGRLAARAGELEGADARTAQRALSLLLSMASPAAAAEERA